jgi:uncharacterized protein
MSTVSEADFPYQFECRRSGNCCAIPGGFVRVTEHERRAIAEHLGLSEAAFQSRYLQPDGVHLKEGFGNRCTFLQDGAQAGCSIYPVRPHKCRDWPFWPEILSNASLLQLVQRTCPGISPKPTGGANPVTKTAPGR